VAIKLAGNHKLILRNIIQIFPISRNFPFFFIISQYCPTLERILPDWDSHACPKRNKCVITIVICFSGKKYKIKCCLDVIFYECKLFWTLCLILGGYPQVEGNTKGFYRESVYKISRKENLKI
jgi:hypothetical protein